MDVAVVGAGRVGTALAVLLSRAGHEVVAVSGRSHATAERAAEHLPGVPVLPAHEAASRANLVVIATPDDAIQYACEALAASGALRPGQWVLHPSGSLGLDVLSAASDAGAGILSLHPLQTIPDAGAGVARIPGSTIAVTAEDHDGLEFGRRVAEEIGGRPFTLEDEVKPLYHAAAVFASNYLVASLAVAEELFERAGLHEPLPALMPLVRASVENADVLGPALALTGPAVRGDAGTIERNLEAISETAPDAIAPYVAMARVALDLGERSGRLGHEERLRVEEVLTRWT